MKKFLVFALIAAVAGVASAQNLQWLGDSYIYHVEEDVWYQASGTDGWATGGAFQGADFGIVSSLTLGGQAQTWQQASGVTVTMFWEVFEGATSVADGTIGLTYLDSPGSNDRWENVTGVNVAAGLNYSTEYTAAVWFNATREGDTTQWDSNSGNNFVANFETDAIPEPATMSLLGLGALAMVIRRKIKK